MKVSIIVPVYNVARRLPQCIMSLQQQTYRDIEIILVDDGSTDASGAICDDFAKEDNRVRVFHKENGGVSSARNFGMKQITGAYLLFVDGDDAIDPNTVEQCVSQTENGKWDFVVFGFHHYTDDNGILTYIQDTPHEEQQYVGSDQIKRNLAGLSRAGVVGFVCDKLIRVACIEKANASFDSYFDMGGEDGLFIMQLLPVVNYIKVIDACYYRYIRRVGESTTVTFHKDKFDRYYQRTIKTLEFMQTYGKLDEEYISRTYAEYILWHYESMLSNTFTMSKEEIASYLRQVFHKPEPIYGINRKVRKLWNEEVMRKTYCITSRMALWLIAKKWFFLLEKLYAVTKRRANKHGKT